MSTILSTIRALWAAFIALWSTSKKSSRPILPVIHVHSPETTPVDIALGPETTWRNSWEADKARFIRNPSFSKRASQLSISTVTQDLPLAKNESVKFKFNDFPEPPIVQTPSPSPAKSLSLSDFFKRCYPPHVLSAVSGYLYDHSPIVTKRKSANALNSDNHQLDWADRSCHQSVPYPDLFDFTVYDRRASKGSTQLGTIEDSDPHDKEKENRTSLSASPPPMFFGTGTILNRSSIDSKVLECELARTQE